MSAFVAINGGASSNAVPIGLAITPWSSIRRTTARTVPSSAWSLLVAAVLIVGFGALYSGVRVTRPPQDPAAIASFDPTAVSLSGLQLAQLAIGVLGALLITGEYATGMIRTSFAAVPARLPVLWGKAIGYALSVLALAGSLAAFVVIWVKDWPPPRPRTEERFVRIEELATDVHFYAWASVIQDGRVVATHGDINALISSVAAV